MVAIQKNFQSKSPFGNIFWLAVGFIIACFLFLLIESAGLKKGYYTLIIFSFTILLAYYLGYRQRYRLQLTNIFRGILLCLLIILLYRLALTYMSIRQWDFLCLYLFGKVGISGSEFYNPHVFSQFFNDLDLQNRTHDNYITVIVNVGFWYPPPSMFFFLPLGLFSMKTGYIFWQTLISIFLIIDIFLLYKCFAPVKNTRRIREFKDFLPLLLILNYPHVTASIQYSQTVSLFLFFLILLINYLKSWKSGIVLAILIIIKPLAAIFGLYFLVFRKWKTLLAFSITGALILVLTVLVFGYNNLLDYFISPPADRIPFIIYYETINQSLYSVLLRLQANIFGSLNIKLVKIVTYFFSFLFIVATVYASRILHKKSDYFSFIVYIPLALLIYPASLSHYNIILLPVVLFIFTQKLFPSLVLNLIFFFIIYGIGLYSLFLFNLVLWVLLVTWPICERYANRINLSGTLFSKVKSKKIEA